MGGGRAVKSRVNIYILLGTKISGRNEKVTPAERWPLAKVNYIDHVDHDNSK